MVCLKLASIADGGPSERSSLRYPPAGLVVLGRVRANVYSELGRRFVFNGTIMPK